VKTFLVDGIKNAAGSAALRFPSVLPNKPTNFGEFRAHEGEFHPDLFRLLCQRAL